MLSAPKYRIRKPVQTRLIELPPLTIKRNREAQDLRYTLSPLAYTKSLGFTPFEWQQDILTSTHKRKAINGARQSGKSTIISVKPCHKARFFPGSLSLVAAPTERQAVLNMERIRAFIALDPDYPDIKRASDELIELANGSRIAVVPATERAARGYSSPDIVMLDEASRIEDPVYRSGIMPMFTDNAKCELILISTPRGRLGFFHHANNSERWEKYEVRAPWEVIDLEYRLVPAMPEEEYKKKKAIQGIRAYYSPRHYHIEEQQMNLEEMAPLMYRQEYCCEFVEPEDQVFSYDDIAAMAEREVTPLDVFPEREVEPLGV
jgi:hypothetical protein